MKKKARLVQVCFSLPAEVARELDRVRPAWQSRSGLVREIVEAYLKKIQAN